MTSPRTKYTEEYRRETAGYIILTGRPVAAVAAEPGLHQKTAARWVAARKKNLSGEVPSSEGNDELKAAQKRIRELEMESSFLKKAALRERAGVAPRYQLMFAEKDNYPVKWMATRLEVSRSGYYSWLAKGLSEDSWQALRQVIERIRLEPDRRFGARLIHSLLPGELLGATLYRVRKYMRELGIKGCTPYRSKRTTMPDKNAKARPDLVHRDFTSPVPTFKLAGGIAYLRTGQGWLYLSTAIDSSTRMAVGWSLPERMAADIAVSALSSAKARGYVAENAIFHSGKGAQYASRSLAEWARDNSVRLSCSRTGNRHDSAVAESFFATLKNEMYHRRSFSTRAEAKMAVVNFIESHHNRKRPHSTIGYRIPAEAMEDFFRRTAPMQFATQKAA